MRIKAIKKIKKEHVRYDLKIDDYSCYYANDILVHNTDGQNLQVTWRDGALKAARNKTTIKNPLDIDEVAAKFAGRGNIKDAFVNTMRDLQNAILTLSDKQKEKIFKGGTRFINLEIIYPPTQNVIEYGSRAILQFHNADTWDIETAKKISSDKKTNVKLLKMLDKNNALQQDVFEIKGPIKLTLSSKDFSKEEAKYIKEVDKIQKNGGYSGTTTMKEYFVDKWSKYIDSKLKNISPEVKEILINRWVLQTKEVNIRQIKKMVEPSEADTISKIDKEQPKIQKEFAIPLEMLFLKLGAEVLQNVSGFLAVNPKQGIKNMTKALNSLVKEIQNDKNAKPEVLAKLEFQLRRLGDIGKDKIIPIEGFVFKYKGKVFKMTGAFASLNQILGVLKFSR